MGAYKPRRPFVWQDEMAEVRNLFKRVAKVKQSGFSGFSLWKDEPTAETLSRNRLRKRRSQYAIELTHLNYAESPFEALNHLHNIRGMCSRIQRQDRFVERKKKDYDLDLHPALLRRPVTVSYPWTSKDAYGSDKVSLRSSRPVSAPVIADTPLHYTPSKPKILYDATHRRPRYKDPSRRNPLSQRSARSSSIGSLKAMADHYNWDSKGRASSSIVSTPIASSMATSMRASASPSVSTSPTFRLPEDFSISSQLGDVSITSKSKENLDQACFSEAERSRTSRLSTPSRTPALYYEESDEASAFSTGRPSSMSPVDRPPSRMMSKRPPTDMCIGTKTNGGNPHGHDHLSIHYDAVAHLKDDRLVHKESTIGHDCDRVRDSLTSTSTANVHLSKSLSDGLASHSSKPPSLRKLYDGGKLLVVEEQRIKTSSGNLVGASSSIPEKGKHKLSASPGDGADGLWALKQEQRPASASALVPHTSNSSGTSKSYSSKHFEHVTYNGRPSTSPTRVADHFPKQERHRTSRFGIGSSSIKVEEKMEQLHPNIVPKEQIGQDTQSLFRESRNVSNDGKERNVESIFGASTSEGDQEINSRASLIEHGKQLHHHTRQDFGEVEVQSSKDNTGLRSVRLVEGSTIGEQSAIDVAATIGDESHIMIKHSKDPYADFKNSMLRMIHEENLYDKQWELEELFQYYMDLNPVVHHEVLKVVVSDIRKDMASHKYRTQFCEER